MPEEERRSGTSLNPFHQYVTPSPVFDFFNSISAFFRNNIVLPLRKNEQPVYYHRKFPRVPTIDQCEIGDPVCRYEANEQYFRDKKVDTFKLKILRRRWTECNYYYGANKREKCKKERKDFEDNSVNYLIRYGEMARYEDSLEAYMKQKHRMIWMRRKQEAGEHVEYTE